MRVQNKVQKIFHKNELYEAVILLLRSTKQKGAAPSISTLLDDPSYEEHLAVCGPVERREKGNGKLELSSQLIIPDVRT
jgi:hypothetical protein